MKKTLNLALLAVVGAALSVGTPAGATGYNSDLIIGFSAGSGNDLLYDLGLASSLTNGQNWNLNSLISGYDLATVKWGVIGNTTNGTSLSATNTVYTTTVASSTLPAGISSSGYKSVNAAAGAMYNPFPAAGAGQFLQVAFNTGSGNSWYQQTVSPTLTTQYKNAYEDPNVVGLTSAALWAVNDKSGGITLLGSLSLAANGVVTFTKATTTTPPPPPLLSITRSGLVSSVSFLSTNGATYTLFFTNHIGLSAPVTNWPAMPGTITGDGSTKSFQDTTADSDRFYRVGAH